MTDLKDSEKHRLEHEINTRLCRIIGVLELLRIAENLTPEQTLHIKSVLSELRELSAFLNREMAANE